MSTPGEDLVVTGIGAAVPWTVSPNGLLDGGAGTGTADGWFDVSSQLGRRGYKYLPPACLYLLASARRAVADARGLLHVPARQRAGVLGTNYALSAMFAEMNQTVITTHADNLSPASAPYFAVNVIGSRLSTEHQLQAFTMTLTTPRTAGIEAIEAGARAVAAGRCATVLAAAMEHGRNVGEQEVPVEQGAVVLVQEPRRSALARRVPIYGAVRAGTSFVPPHRLDRPEARYRLDRLVADWLDARDPGRRAAIYPMLDPSPVGKALAEAVQASRSGERVVHPAITVRAGCLTPMIWVAGLLAGRAGDSVVIVGTREGNIGLAWLSADAAGPGTDTTGGTPC